MSQRQTNVHKLEHRVTFAVGLRTVDGDVLVSLFARLLTNEADTACGI